MRRNIIAAIFSLIATNAAGDSAVVEKVVATKTGDSWKFSVTLRHGDVGWDHYADGWGVYTVDGQELGYRILHHPHVDEQPFTRSLGSVPIPNAGQTHEGQNPIIFCI